jgi:predicted dinucleotide-binding enzyme
MDCAAITADRLAALDETPGRQVAAVAGDADAALGFAGQHRADLDALDTGRLNRRRQFSVISELMATITLPS